MPLRAKFKKALGGGTPSPNDSSTEKPEKTFLNKTSARHKIFKSNEYKDWPENVYKPGEVMPRPKYRAPWNQAHQDTLSAFSFGSSSRRRRSSATARSGSQYSPMGSKLPSRGPSRRNSAISWGSIKGGVGAGISKKRPKMSSRQQSAISDAERVEESGEEGNDVGNVGLSRQHTKERVPMSALAKKSMTHDDDEEDDDTMDPLATSKTVTNGQGSSNGFSNDLDHERTITNGALFTEEELAQALTASTLKASRKVQH